MLVFFNLRSVGLIWMKCDVNVTPRRLPQLYTSQFLATGNIKSSEPRTHRVSVTLAPCPKSSNHGDHMNYSN
jgi:hypothetical protein